MLLASECVNERRNKSSILLVIAGGYDDRVEENVSYFHVITFTLLISCTHSLLVLILCNHRSFTSLLRVIICCPSKCSFSSTGIWRYPYFVYVFSCSVVFRKSISDQERNSLLLATTGSVHCYSSFMYDLIQYKCVSGPVHTCQWAFWNRSYWGKSLIFAYGQSVIIFPNQALSFGTPVIAVNSGGPLETIMDGKTGFLCEQVWWM